MSHTFKVGEIAIIAAVDHPNVRGDWVGKEVEILGPLEQFRGEASYRISHPLGRLANAYAAQRHLRKRRPPQDWVKLCNLTDIPREVVHG